MALLEAKDIHAGYGPVEVLRGLDFEVNEGEVVVILGANGAGKTTTLRALSGMIDTRGSFRFKGDELVGKDPADIVRLGIAHVPQGRGTFPELTVEDNLHAGAYARKDGEIKDDIESWYDSYPVLGERRRQQAGSLSGGEQQMLAVARALMSRPEVLLLDEPSLGLAPLIVKDLFERFAELNRERGVTMLLVEQSAQIALGIADRAYVLESGSIVVEGTAKELREDDSIRRAYLGVDVDDDTSNEEKTTPGATGATAAPPTAGTPTPTEGAATSTAATSTAATPTVASSTVASSTAAPAAPPADTNPDPDRRGDPHPNGETR